LAPFALAARPVGGASYPCALFNARNVGAGFGDFAGKLVTQHERIDGAVFVVSLAGEIMGVRTAYTHRTHAYENLLRTRVGDSSIL
jgi:hypothetical protein